MIRIHGSTHTAEYSAAQRLRDLIGAWDPNAKLNGHKKVEILVGERLAGVPPVEVDLILILWKEGSATFPIVDSPKGRAVLESLVLTIEVKDVDERRVRFRGTNVEISYDGRWEDATAQIHKQPHALKRHLRDRGVTCDPFVSGLGWLRGVPHEAVPSTCTQALGGDSTFEHFLTAAFLEGTPVESTAKGPAVRSIAGDVPTNAARVAEVFTRTIRPSNLDRRRVEAISRKWLDDQKYAAELGKRMLLIKGAAGTGKTIALLRIARDLIMSRSAKILFLTYNNALLSDLRRMIGHNPDLFGVASNKAQFTLKTVDSFIRRLGTALECDAVKLHGLDYAAKHSAIKQELLVLLEGNCQEYVREIRLRDPETFDHDFVLVDEGQDWPVDECVILRKLIGYERMIVATSPSQVQRGARPTDWTSGLPGESHHRVSLKKVRRLSDGLFRFSQDFLKASGGDQVEEVSSDSEITGGQVHIVTGDYFSKPALHNTLIAQLLEDENAPVDMLFVVPPGDGARGEDGQYGSFAARELAGLGHEVWDGTRQDTKRVAPTSVEQIRVVNYRSVRGLEGWTVVLLGLDRYYAWLLEHPEGVPEQADVFADPLALARFAAAQQLAIPMTRAVKNLVIEVRDETSPVATWLKALHQKHHELSTWHTGELYSAPSYRAPPSIPVRRVAEGPSKT